MINLCKSLLQRTDLIILDTETTGLDHRAEAVSIAIINGNGDTLLNTLVKPVNPIPTQASAIHGIEASHVATAPTFIDLLPKLQYLISGKTVAIYNADYDTRILQQSYDAHMTQPVISPLFPLTNWVDIMAPYAEYWGDWSDWHNNYKWQRLSAACRQQGIEVKDAHAALGDCKMTLALIKAIAAKDAPKFESDHNNEAPCAECGQLTADPTPSIPGHPLCPDCLRANTEYINDESHRY